MWAHRCVLFARPDNSTLPERIVTWIYRVLPGLSKLQHIDRDFRMRKLHFCNIIAKC